MPDARPATRLLWIRHAQAEVGATIHPETPLSPLGRRQARALARALVASDQPDALYTSPFARAWETAETLARALHIEAVVEPRLVEFRIGIEGEMSMTEALEQRPDLQIWRAEQGPPGGETLGAFSARIGRLCEEIVARHAGGRVLLVAHAGTIDAALRWAVGLPAASPWQHEFDLTNASLTEVSCWPEGRVAGGAPRYAVISRVADVSHLGSELTSDG